MAPLALVEEDSDGDYVPPFGAYLVLTLDAVATVKIYNDPIATAAAGAIPRRTYVGYANGGAGLPSPSRSYHDLSCVFLCQGRPQSDPAQGIDENFCVPVGNANCPEGRKSIHPSPPLPSNWQNLYHHTMSIHHLRFETRPEDYVACSRISSEDMVYYDAAYYTDGAIAYERQQKYERQSKSCESSVFSSRHNMIQRRRSTVWRRLLSLHKSSTDTRSSPQPVRAVEVAEESYDLSASFSRVMEKAERGSGDAPTAQIESAPHASSITGPDPSLAVKMFNELGEIAVRIAGDLFGYEDPRDRFVPIVAYSPDLSKVTELADGRLLSADLAALRR
ncbi:hypothetical protein FA95DRAFT_1565686 [Auriscalpium vulgare]|uniref:Uncharacterized protein n=1 Tax=Auriscalpium vulgare TaxID=40419 RepID=A0ACB8RBE4_9AGAM|nr:hypothetical protein FA95DRAFT_1565686 [Auriscalpium vulgare]